MTRSPSRRSFVVDSLISGVPVVLVRGDPCLSSCEVMALDQYINLKGVNPVARDSIVLSAQMTSCSCSTHLPFLSSRSLFFMALKFFSVDALYYPIILWVVDKREHYLRADGIAEFPEVLIVELFVVVYCQLGGTLKRQTMFYQKNFCVVFVVIIDIAVTSIHLVKYSTTTKANLRLPYACNTPSVYLPFKSDYGVKRGISANKMDTKF
jgi:hypothetical protein